MFTQDSELSPLKLHFISKLILEASQQLGLLNLKNTKALKDCLKKNYKSTPVNSNIFSNDAIQTRFSNLNYMEKEKIGKEICCFESILYKLSGELSVNGSYNILNDYVDEEFNEKESLTDLIKAYFENKKLLITLQNRLKYIQNSKSEIVLDYNKQIKYMKLLKDDFQLFETCKVRTVRRWENARRSQNFIRLFIKEQDMVYEEQQMQKGVNQDYMINFHIERYLDSNISDMLDAIGEWDDRISNELDELEVKMQDYNEKRHKFDTQKKNYEELYTKHKQVIDEHNEKIRKEKELILMAKCSIKIQAWWRGVMVRKKLGPFKPKLSKKNKGKKKSKKYY